MSLQSLEKIWISCVTCQFGFGQSKLVVREDLDPTLVRDLFTGRDQPPQRVERRKGNFGSKHYVQGLETQSGKANLGRRKASKRLETRASGKTANEWKTSMYGEFSTSYTSQNPQTILRSFGNTRIRHLKMPIRIFWCLRVPTSILVQLYITQPVFFFFFQCSLAFWVGDIKEPSIQQLCCGWNLSVVFVTKFVIESVLSVVQQVAVGYMSLFHFDSIDRCIVQGGWDVLERVLWDLQVFE